MDYFKRHKFDWSKFRLGMRTFKTGIAVFIVLLIFGIFGWRGLQIGTLTAVFSLREDFDKSVHFGASRVMGNSIGGFYAVLFITLSIPNGETFLYVFARIFETFIGVFVAILVNSDVDRIRDFLKKHKKTM